MFEHINKAALVAAAFAACAATATQAHAEGLYIGGSLGTPHYAGSVDGVGAAGGGHDTGAGGSVYGGYALSPNFALEGGYADLGHSRDVDGRVHAQTVFVDGVGRWEFLPQWSLLGSVGVAEGHFKTANGDDNSLALKTGLGLQYTLTKTTSVQLGYDRYHFNDVFDGRPNIGEASLGLKIGF